MRRKETGKEKGDWKKKERGAGEKEVGWERGKGEEEEKGERHRGCKSVPHKHSVPQCVITLETTNLLDTWIQPFIPMRMRRKAQNIHNYSLVMLAVIYSVWSTSSKLAPIAYSHFVYSHFFYSHFAYSHFVYSHFANSDVAYSHFTYFRRNFQSFYFCRTQVVQASPLPNDCHKLTILPCTV